MAAILNFSLKCQLSGNILKQMSHIESRKKTKLRPSAISLTLQRKWLTPAILDLNLKQVLE